MGWLPLLATICSAGIAALVYLAWYSRWELQHTTGMAYFGRSPAERALVKRRMRRYSRPVAPLVRAMALWQRDRADMPAFEYEGVCGPPTISSPAAFARAASYQPGDNDVFVVTQMRSGTTWMLQLVYQIVTGSRGELGGAAYPHLNAVCPWIETTIGVPLEQAPLVGDRGTRIIKTHLPAALCPYSERAKYIYVVRHPVACFASVAEYMRQLLGPLAPPSERLAGWYCGDRMYWQPWPRHVGAWRALADSRPNVMFVRYEDMVRDFDGVLDRVAAFLGRQLAGPERDAVVRKCSFAYMKAREDVFEMTAPTMFSVGGQGFFSGAGAAAGVGIAPAIRSRILDQCRGVMASAGYSVQ